MKLRDFLKSVEDSQVATNSSKVWICGGVARDKVLNRLDKINDLDLTTGDQSINTVFINLIKKLNQEFPVNYKLMSDGHKTLEFSNFKVDFSSNYITPNIEYYLAKLGVKNSTPLQQEMYSRDFTINSLLLDFDLKSMQDPTNRGLSDIKSKMIDTNLDPQITLLSFRNRVVRAIYLAAKLDFDIHP